jgi:hypothetical protein
LKKSLGKAMLTTVAKTRVHPAPDAIRRRHARRCGLLPSWALRVFVALLVAFATPGGATPLRSIGAIFLDDEDGGGCGDEHCDDCAACCLASAAHCSCCTASTAVIVVPVVVGARLIRPTTSPTWATTSVPAVGHTPLLLRPPSP